MELPTGDASPPRAESERDHRWRLTDAKCAQLADAVRAARLPFLLSLTWGFIWLSALYDHDFGYTNTLVKRYENAFAQITALVASSQEPTEVPASPPDVTPAGTNGAAVPGPAPRRRLMSVDEQRVVEEKFQKIVHDAGLHRWHVVQGYESIETTRLALKAQLERLWQQQVEYWTVNLPGIAGRMTVFDLGVVGQFGLLLIMVWFYYASRRENHSLRAFVDIREEIQKYNMNPDRFTLAPEEPSLQVQHYVYAYHAVAQRFLFLVSRRSTALMLTLICLIALPLAVASYNFLTDVRDVLGIPAVGTQGWIRVGLECFLLIGVAITSFRVVAFQCQTGVLLNGWYLACRDCWQPEHDNESATRSVKIDRVMQRARYPRKKSRDLRAESIAVGRG